MRADDAPATGAKLSLGLHHGRATRGFLVRGSNKSSQFVRRLHEHCPTVMPAIPRYAQPPPSPQPPSSPQPPVIPAQAGIQSVRIELAARGEFRKPWIPASAGMTKDLPASAGMTKDLPASAGMTRT